MACGLGGLAGAGAIMVHALPYITPIAINILSGVLPVIVPDFASTVISKATVYIVIGATAPTVVSSLSSAGKKVGEFTSLAAFNGLANVANAVKDVANKVVGFAKGVEEKSAPVEENPTVMTRDLKDQEEGWVSHKPLIIKS